MVRWWGSDRQIGQRVLDGEFRSPLDASKYRVRLLPAGSLYERLGSLNK